MLLSQKPLRPVATRLTVPVIIMLAYACITVLIPKLDISGLTFYVTEPLFLVTVVLSVIYGKYRVVGPIDATYLLFCAMCFLAIWEGYYYTGLIDIQAVAKIIKYVMFVTMIGLAVRFRNRISEKQVRRIISIELLFIAVTGLYVLYNIARLHPSVYTMIWGYSNKFRLVGFTGYALKGTHLTLAGTTSVSMGVFVAFIGLLCGSFFSATRRVRYLVACIIVAVGELLTFSRTGFGVLLLGWLYMAWVNRSSRRLWLSIVVVVLLLGAVIAVFGTQLFQQLSSIGSLSRFSTSKSGVIDASTNERIRYVHDAIKYVSAHPAVLLFGTGYGQKYTYALINTPILESLIFTTTFQCGILTTIVLLAHFFWIWRLSRNGRMRRPQNFWAQITFGIEAFVPGLFVANLIGGDSLQTDFFAPLFYFMIGISLAKLRFSDESADARRA